MMLPRWKSHLLVHQSTIRKVWLDILQNLLPPTHIRSHSETNYGRSRHICSKPNILKAHTQRTYCSVWEAQCTCVCLVYLISVGLDGQSRDPEARVANYTVWWHFCSATHLQYCAFAAPRLRISYRSGRISIYTWLAVCDVRYLSAMCGKVSVMWPTKRLVKNYEI